MKFDGSEEAAVKRTSSLVSGVFHVLMILLILGALVSLYLGLGGYKEAGDNAITSINFLALAAVLGIFARIAQAAKHHEITRNR